MKKLFILFLLVTASSTLVAGSNNDLFSFLMPQHIGTLGKLGQEVTTTQEVSITCCSDGFVHKAYYTDGIIVTVISGENDKKVGFQYVLRADSELSRSKQFFADPEQFNVIIHVHNRFLVDTHKDKQEIIPR